MAVLARATPPDTAALFEQIRMSAVALAHHFPQIDPTGTALLKWIIETCERGVVSAQPHSARVESLEHSLNDITNMLTVTLGHVSIAQTASPARSVDRRAELEYACQAAELGVSAAFQLAALVKAPA